MSGNRGFAVLVAFALAIVIALAFLTGCASPPPRYMKSFQITSQRVIGGNPVTVSESYLTYFLEKPDKWPE